MKRKLTPDLVSISVSFSLFDTREKRKHLKSLDCHRRGCSDGSSPGSGSELRVKVSGSDMIRFTPGLI